MSKKIGSLALVIGVILFATSMHPRVAAAVDPTRGGVFQPVYTVVDHPVPKPAQHLPLDVIRRAIIGAGAMRQWSFEAAGPGALLATQKTRGLVATVKVTYSQTAYGISLVETNLDRSDDLIHGTYNRWVRNLEKDIDILLTSEGLQSN